MSRHFSPVADDGKKKAPDENFNGEINVSDSEDEAAGSDKDAEPAVASLLLREPEALGSSGKKPGKAVMGGKAAASTCQAKTRSAPVRSGSARSLADPSDNASVSELGGEKDRGKPDSMVLQEWIAKLPLEPIFLGKKQGVSLNHAETKAKRMQPAYGDILQTHVQLARWATVLQVEELAKGKGTSKEVHEAISGLQAAESVTLPSENRVALWKLHSQAKLTQLKQQFQESRLHDWWHFMRPLRSRR